MERYGVDYGNKIGHVFENGLHDHQLDFLVNEFGSEGKAFLEVQRTVDALNLPNGVIGSGGIAINVGEYSTTIVVRGYVQDGLVKISTMFRP